MTRTWIALVLSVCLPSAAMAQELSPAERAGAMSRVRTLADCVERQHTALQRVLRLIREAEQQRDRSSDARVRQDAERAIDALIGRAAAVRAEGRACFEGADLPSPGGAVVTRPPPDDPAADRVSGTGGTVREVERDTVLAPNLLVARAEQVDGQGEVDAEVIRSAVRAIVPRLRQCYGSYLERGSLAEHRLDLVFTFHGRGRARRVAIERSDFADATFERCVRGAGQQLQASQAPRGGDAVFSYTLRFGRLPAR